VLVVVLLTAPHASLGTTNARYQSVCQHRKVQVLSDIDDTMTASGDKDIAGVDSRWQFEDAYAGFAQFYLELSLGATGKDVPEGMAIVSARPKELGSDFSAVKAELRETTERPFNQQLHIPADWSQLPPHKVLSGHLLDNIHIHKSKRFEAYGDTKVDRIKEFDKEKKKVDVCLIFVGDNGQGDKYAGARLLKELPKSVAAIFIHVVTSKPELNIPTPPNLFTFTTYPDAARTAFLNGMITLKGLERVIQAAEDPNSEQYPKCKVLEAKQHTENQWANHVIPHPLSADGGCTHLFQDLKAARDLLVAQKRLIKAEL